MTQEVNQNFTMPRGKALWANLQAPDTKFNPDGVYRIDVVLEATSDPAKNLKRRIDQAFEQNLEYQSINKSGVKPSVHFPYKDEEDQDGNPTGNLIFKTKTSATRPTARGRVPHRPKVFSRSGQPLDQEVGNGSEVAVNVTMRGHNKGTNGAGVTLYLEAVMVYELVPVGDRSAEEYGFEVEQDEIEEAFNDAAEGDEIIPF